MLNVADEIAKSLNRFKVLRGNCPSQVMLKCHDNFHGFQIRCIKIFGEPGKWMHLLDW